MKFQFPTIITKQELAVPLDEERLGKVEAIAQQYSCTPADICETFIREALEEYEKQFGAIVEKAEQQVKAEKAAQSIAEPEKKVEAQTANKPWSKFYPNCIDCHSTERKYMGRGFCTRCYFKPENKKQGTEPAKHRIDDRFAKMYREKDKKLDDAVHSSVTDCPSNHCTKGGKYVLGAGFMHTDGIEYCSKLCAETNDYNKSL